MTPLRTVRKALSYLPRGQTLPRAEWRRRHHVVVGILGAHAIVLPLLGLLLGSGGAQAGAYFILLLTITAAAGAPSLSRDVRSAIAGVGLVVCSSVLVQVSHGAVEAHFHFFVMVPIVALYEDWLPFGLAAGYVLAQHGLVGTIAPQALYDHSSSHIHPWAWAAVHTGFFIAACAGALANWKFAELARLEQQDLAQSMRYQARHDPLTGLPNRALLLEAGHDMVVTAVEGGQPLSVLMIDLDRFKEVNDTLGHNWGDALLVQVAERLTGALREADILVRIGGDEFAVLLPATDGPSAAQIAQRMRTRMSSSFELADLRLDVDASIGCATWRPEATPHLPSTTDADADPVETAFANLMRQADIAMYAAKYQGDGVRSYVWVEDVTNVDRLTVLTELRRALQNHELVLHFQPKVRLDDGVVIGAEALVRWQHPDRGLLSPDEFVPFAENSALVFPLTEKVLDLAVQQAKVWLDEGEPLQIAVNVSPRSLHSNEFAAVVLRTLTRHGLPGHLLRLEITETSLMTDADVSARVLGQLGRHGVGLSIDDFGTGYSSMTHLRQLPVDELKIDKSFVRSLPADVTSSPGSTRSIRQGRLDEDLVIIRTAIQLAHSLGLSVVAEGVEHEAALEVLRGLGCEAGQGYLFSRPLPPAAFAAYLASARPAAVAS